jgi:hypothetical protein
VRRRLNEIKRLSNFAQSRSLYNDVTFCNALNKKIVNNFRQQTAPIPPYTIIVSICDLRESGYGLRASSILESVSLIADNDVQHRGQVQLG